MLGVCMYVYVFMYMYIYIYIYIYIYTHIHRHTYAYIHMYTDLYHETSQQIELSTTSQLAAKYTQMPDAMAWTTTRLD
jgi:hypothetical protein